MTATAQTDAPPRCRSSAGLILIGLVFTSLLQVGCAGPRVNPSFPLSIQRAKTELQQMQNDPKKLTRPVVVLGGWVDFFGKPPAYLAKQLRLATGYDPAESDSAGDERVISVGFGGCTNFDQCRRRVIERIEENFPSNEPGHTTEVDIVGYSMGGLVARYAATPTEGGTGHLARLRIARLYTISAPHRGAEIAKFALSSSLGKDMRTGSDFLQHLDEHWVPASYAIVPYVRLGDAVVGATNAAPHEQTPIWVPQRPFSRAHNDAFRDPRLIADIARRLRSETPYTTEPFEAVPQ